MKNRALILLKGLVVTAGMAFLLAGCGGGGGGGGGDTVSGGTGSLSLGITDAPVDDLYKVYVTFTEVIINPADGGGRIVVDVTDDMGKGRKIELKALGEGEKVMLLDEYPLPAGDYSWVRLVIDPDETYVVVDEGGAELLLDCPSCAPSQSGLKLNRPFSLEGEGWVDFTIDFDLRKSITLRNRNKPNPKDFDYKLRPTLRIVDAELASSFIWGTVTDVRQPPLGNPDNPSGCMVYVYEGDVNPDDICMTEDDPPVDCISPAGNARPLTEADVELDIGSGDYMYRTGFIYPGTYTVALVCEDDDPLLDEDLLYIGTDVVDAPAGAFGKEKNFLLEDVVALALDKQIVSDGPYTLGSEIKYDYVVTNTGNLGLAGPVSVDDNLTTVDCPPVNEVGNLDDDLNPGEKITCTSSYTVTADDVIAGTVINLATASADGVDSNQAQATADIVAP